MIPVSPEAEQLLKFTIDLLQEQEESSGVELEPRLIAHFETLIAEKGDYSEFKRRISSGEDPAKIQSEYGTISPDYSSLHFGIGGYPPAKHRPEWRAEFIGTWVAISPTYRRLLEGRSLELERATMKVRAVPQPPEELIREVYKK